MPKLYEYLGMVFFFFSRDHLPMHLHVRYQDHQEIAELLFDANGSLQLRWRSTPGYEPLPLAKRRKAEKLIRAKSDDIVRKWTDHFARGRHFNPERITDL